MSRRLATFSDPGKEGKTSSLALFPQPDRLSRQRTRIPQLYQLPSSGTKRARSKEDGKRARYVSNHVTRCIRITRRCSLCRIQMSRFHKVRQLGRSPDSRPRVSSESCFHFLDQGERQSFVNHCFDVMLCRF